MSTHFRSLVDKSLEQMDVSGSEVIRSDHGGFLIMGSGSDGTAQYLKINEDGELVTTISDVLIVTASVDVTGNVDQGAAGTHDEAWFFRLSDGTALFGVEANPLVISGTVGLEGGEITVGNFPAVQEITGTVALEGGDVTVGNFPNTQSVDIGSSITLPVSISNFLDSQTIDGTVSVDNFPSVQTISGVVQFNNPDIEVSNFPATQTVDGTVSVDNFPAVQTISGVVQFNNPDLDVNVQNFPASQTIDGTVAVSNLAATQSVAPSGGPSSIVTLYTGSTLSTQFLSANPDRKLATFFVSGTNEDDPVVWLKLGGSAASTSAYSVMLSNFDGYELPRGYTGEVYGIFNMTTGSIEIACTEIF